VTKDNYLRGIGRRALMTRTALIGAGFAAGPLVLAACADESTHVDKRSEGEALAPFRDQVAIASKFGFERRRLGSTPEPARAHQEGGRGVTHAAADRPHRPVGQSCSIVTWNPSG
jgi:hypothetical protein